MDIKAILSAFGIVFLAELGDKTQLSILFFSMRSHRPWSVFLGAAVALVLTTAVAVALGYFGRVMLPERLMRWLAGAAFVGIGVWMLLSKP